MPRFRMYLPRIHSSNVTAQGDEQLPQEAALFALITMHADQQRKLCNLHQTLCKVARARAQDMATRGYLAHVDPDGIGPNRHVINAGYKLPAWWGDKQDANYIESASSGNPTAQDVMISWLGSPGHRTHVLGEGFYSDQVNVGVGYAANENSPGKRYWVLLSAPAENS